MANAEFVRWATGFSGCDGGDIDSSQSKCIWFCGIEWGVGDTSNENELYNIFSNNVELPAEGYKNESAIPGWMFNLRYRFNWQAMKLLVAIDGGHVSTYKEFAENTQPFTEGAKGYFKMNLYPFSFKNTSHQLWKNGCSNVTGFESKQDYIEWIRAHRFPVMKSWVETYSPKLILCVGKSYLEDFALAFADNGLVFKCEVIDDREFSWAINKNGTIVAVLPFMLNRNGLTKNVSIQKFGDRIRELILNPL